jgi:DNA-binding NarL/FixJ family response regulator
VLSAQFPALAKDWRNSGIAREPLMAENTMEFHIRHLFGNLAASSRSEVIATAHHPGRLDSQDPLC